MTGSVRDPADVAAVAAAVAAAGRPVDAGELAALVRAEFSNPTLPSAAVDQLVDAAVTSGLLVDDDGSFTAAGHTTGPQEAGGEPDADTGPAAPWSPRRVVAIDVETVPRQTTEAPYVHRVVFQVGLARFGTDTDWCAASPTYRTWVAVGADTLELIESERARSAVERDGADPAVVAQEVAWLLADADAIVAYNGIEVDFPVIDTLLRNHDLAVPTMPRIDGLYISHAVWSTRADRSHRLFDLAAALDVRLDGLHAHDAADDATVLARLVETAADVVAQWPDALAELVGSASDGSPTWRLLWTLAGRSEPAAATSAREVRSAVAGLFDTRTPLRHPAGETGTDSSGDRESDPARQAPTATSLTLATSLRVDGQLDGPVDPGRLVAAIRGIGPVETRPAQTKMADRVRAAAADRDDVLIEAPTGTGKTAAMLAAALDHLTADPANRVVISTYTKQLQAQLAADLQALARSGTVTGLGVNVDLVKGARNRLSLRALVVTLAGLCGAGGVTQRLANQPRFRDVVVYLLLRLLAADEQAALTDRWDARSVDTADLPGFFDSYGDGQLAGWLAELSQGRAGDFRASTPDALASHTTSATEAVQGSRLVVANHALLFSNVAAFEPSANRTMLLLDEAHRLEDAATATFESSVDSAQVEALAADLARYAELAAGDDTHRALIAATTSRLDEFLDAQQLPKAVGHVVDVHSASDLLPGRQLRRGTIAASEADAVTLRRGETVYAPLARLRTLLSDCWQALDALPEPGDASARDLHHQLRAKLLDTLFAIASIRRDLAALLGIELHTGETATPATDELETDTGEAPDDVSNRVVWAAEQPSVEFAARGWRWFRFTVATSPVTLGAEPAYRRFRTTFATSVFMSATLRVPGQDDHWSFIRDRLDLDSTVDALALDSPFDPATQARLVCFEDFPSWAEQTAGAIRTVAHQLTGYAHAVVDPDGHNGAMLLTTSRAAAAGISDALLRERARTDGRYDVHSAVLTDNRAAVERFKDTGGILTGTKGLWQGVDIDDAARLRLVWINKLPFPAVGDPILEQRMARIRTSAEAAGATDPDHAALTELYLPLAAIDLRQAVGRLLRSSEHRGVVIISDPKLGGSTVLRRTYRQVFLDSLDPGYRHVPADPDDDPSDRWAGNVVPMEVGWQRIFTFLADVGVLEAAHAAELCAPDRLAAHVWLPQTRTIREQVLTAAEEATFQADGTLAGELHRRGAVVGGALRLSDTPIELKDKQRDVLTAIALGDDVLAVLPTGYGKSFTFQLPALILPGVTLVLSPLVSLMTDQALHLNRTIGGAVRALTGPMRESNSRLGKAEVAEQLTDPDARHGIRIIYLSPERLAQRQFQEQIRTAVERGIVRRIAVDEAHTLAQWGDDFRPQFRRAERFIRDLRNDPDLPKVQLIAVTATATRSVRGHLRRWLFDHHDAHAAPDTVDGFSLVTANPVRPDLAIYRRQMPERDWSKAHYTTVGIVEQVLDQLDGHTIVYAMTVREVDTLHGYLAEQVGTTRTVLRYHGRMPEAEKAAVADVFTTAAKHGEDGYKPMVVIATAAFGLGIDRPDIRTVLLASPPMDLAALYQQLGRAGRDQVGTDPAELTQPSVGMALLTGRGWSTLRFFLEQRPERAEVLDDIARRVLDGTTGQLHAGELAREVMQDEVARQILDPDDLDNIYVRSSYRTMVLRVFAALAATGHVDDLGDFPVKVTLTRGQVTTGDAAATADAILAAAGTGRGVNLLDVWANLDPGLRADLGDVGALWSEMLLLHAAGYLDVSQRANIGYELTTGYRRLRTTADPDLSRQMLDHLRAADGELAALRAWFDPAAGSCANVDLARYFAVDDPPDGVCSVPANRCSSCWDRAVHAGDIRPGTHTAFFVHDPAPASKVASHRRAQQVRLDTSIAKLAAVHRSGFTTSLLTAVLRGETRFGTRAGMREVFPSLRYSRYYGAHPGVTAKPLQAALQRLTDAGVLGRNDRNFWCHTTHLAESPTSTSGNSDQQVPA